MVTEQQYIEHYYNKLRAMDDGFSITIERKHTLTYISITTPDDDYNKLLNLLKILEDNWTYITKNNDGTWTIGISL